MGRAVTSQEHDRVKSKEWNTQSQGKSAPSVGKKHKGPAAGKAGGGKGRKSKKMY